MSDKIIGYKQQPQEVIDAVNSTKELENEVGDWISCLRDVLSPDPKFTAVAVTHFQQGFMALIRALTQPESRLK